VVTGLADGEYAAVLAFRGDVEVNEGDLMSTFQTHLGQIAARTGLESNGFYQLTGLDAGSYTVIAAVVRIEPTRQGEMPTYDRFVAFQVDLAEQSTYQLNIELR